MNSITIDLEKYAYNTEHLQELLIDKNLQIIDQ